MWQTYYYSCIVVRVRVRLRLLLLLALLLLAQRALHGIERCEAAARHDLFNGDAAHGVRVLKCTVAPCIHGSRLAVEIHGRSIFISRFWSSWA